MLSFTICSSRVVEGKSSCKFAVRETGPIAHPAMGISGGISIPVLLASRGTADGEGAAKLQRWDLC